MSLPPSGLRPVTPASGRSPRRQLASAGLAGLADLGCQLVVPEALVPADGGGVALRLRIGPDGVGELAAARADRPVRGGALVGAHSVRVALLEQVLLDVGGRDVEAVRQPGLREQQR